MAKEKRHCGEEKGGEEGEIPWLDADSRKRNYKKERISISKVFLSVYNDVYDELISVSSFYKSVKDM